jgi:hypothetical protein
MSEPAAGPNIGLVSGYAPGASNWGTAMNLNLRTLDALGFFMVRVAPLAAPPSSPAQGDRYIVAPGATGAWAGHDNALTVWTTDETNTALWDFFTPQDGWSAKLVPSSGGSPIQVYTFRAGAWSITTSDIPVFSASGTGHMQGLVPDPGSTAGTTHYLREDSTWATLPAGATYTAFSASGTAHAAGLVPDPGSAAGTTHFLREDATWSTLPAGATYSVFSASGTAHSAGLVPDPGSAAGTTHFLREDSSWATIPAGATYSVFSASGTSHSAGLVPDPGPTAGTTHFLREDSSWATIPVASGWELSDGTHTVMGVTEVIVSGASVSSSGSSTVATLSISGGGTSSAMAPSCFPRIGEAFDWSTGQWNRPALSALTVFFPVSGGGTLTPTEIGSTGLAGPVKVYNPGPGMCHVGVAAPTTPQWTVKVLIEALTFSSQGSGPGMILVDSNNKALWAFVYPGSPPQLYVQEGSLSVSGTGTAASASWNFSSTVANQNLYQTDTLIWMRMRYDGSSYDVEISSDGDIWQGLAESISSSFFTGSLTSIGVIASGDSINYLKLYAFEVSSTGSNALAGTY